MPTKNTYDQWADFPEVTDKRPLDKNPTSFLPGTPEKEIVFQSRLRRKVQLFHPDDARLPERCGFKPVPLGFSDFHRGELVSQEPKRTVVVKDQLERPAPTLYSDGPGNQERRARARARAADPVRLAKDAARNKAARAFRRKAHKAAFDVPRAMQSGTRASPLTHLVTSGMEKSGDV